MLPKAWEKSAYFFEANNFSSTPLVRPWQVEDQEKVHTQSIQRVLGIFLSIVYKYCKIDSEVYLSPWTIEPVIYCHF